MAEGKRQEGGIIKWHKKIYGVGEYIHYLDCIHR